MTPLPRTQDEIVCRIKEAIGRDLLGFEWEEYTTALDWDHVQPFLKKDHTLTPNDIDLDTCESVSEFATKYMSFWLEKIEDERGISVVRATMHFKAWKWLLGHPDADTFPGSDENKVDGGWYQRDAYNYIADQIGSGEFARLTQEAVKAVKA